MAAIEHRILTRILKDKSLAEALRIGLTDKHFKDPESRDIWRHLQKHWYDRETIKTLPTIASVQRKWPAFQLTSGDDEDGALSAMSKDLKVRSFEADARSLATYFQELVDTTDVDMDAIMSMQGHLNELIRERKNSERLGVTDVIDKAMDHYDNAASGNIYGVPWPWDCLTQDTLGKRPGDFVVFYARMKQMKTWVMLYCAIYDYLTNNSRVLIWSREMSKDKMSLRIASLLAKVDYQLLKRGMLPPKVQQRAWTIYKQLKEEDYAYRDELTLKREARLGKRHLLLLCGRDAPRDLPELQGVIQEYHPDVVYLDSFYHLRTGREKESTQRWQRVAELAEDIKGMAEDEEIPIIAVHQANRLGEKTHGQTMADMSDSDVIAREADLVVRILKRRGHELWEEDYELALQQAKEEAYRLAAEKPMMSIGRPRLKLPRKVEEEARRQEAEAKVEVKTENKEDTDDPPRIGAEIALVLGGNREGVLDAFTIHAIPGYNFDFIRSDYSLKEIEDWIRQDEEEDDKPKGASGKVKPQFDEKTFKNYRGGKA